MNGKIQKEYRRRARILLETKLSRRNLIKGINTWAVSLVRYSGPFLKWTREELEQIDQRTGKVMTMHKHNIQETTLTVYMYQERREEEDLAALNTVRDASIQ